MEFLLTLVPSRILHYAIQRVKHLNCIFLRFCETKVQWKNAGEELDLERKGRVLPKRKGIKVNKMEVVSLDQRWMKCWLMFSGYIPLSPFQLYGYNEPQLVELLHFEPGNFITKIKFKTGGGGNATLIVYGNATIWH